jgi:IS1 family transposase
MPVRRSATRRSQGIAAVIRKFEFGPQAEERIARIMEKVNVFEFTIVIRDALQLYEWAVDERELGRDVVSIGKDGRGTRVDF